MEDEDFIIDTAPNSKFHDTPLYHSVVNLLENIEFVPENYLKLIADKLPEEILEPEAIDEKFSVRDELALQMTLVRGLRTTIFDKSGKLRDGYDLDDAKQVLTASKELIKIIQTSQKELINQDRIQAIELAFTDTIMEMPEENREGYLQKLETYLEQYDPD